MEGRLRQLLKHWIKGPLRVQKRKFYRDRGPSGLPSESDIRVTRRHVYLRANPRRACTAATVSPFNHTSCVSPYRGKWVELAAHEPVAPD